MQSMHITTIVVGSNPAYGEVCWIQHYMIKVVGGLRRVGHLPGYFGLLHQKNDRQDIAEILLKVALNTITLTIAPKITS